MRIIDFRLRPPMKAFLDMVMYANIERTEHMARGIGMTLPPSVRERSFELMLEEMDEAGVQVGVVPGRISPVLGTIEAGDIAAIVARRPDRLIGYAGIDPVNRRKAIAAVDAAV
jgi:predicted TIM-barrel fold metal-dependent hydrolase